MAAHQSVAFVIAFIEKTTKALLGAQCMDKLLAAEFKTPTDVQAKNTYHWTGFVHTGKKRESKVGLM